MSDSTGRELLDYHHPDEDPGRKEYTPFTRTLEKPPRNVEDMTAEELVLEAEFLLKQMNLSSGMDLLGRAIELDQGNARARLLLGIYDFAEGRFESAVENLERAIERDPYLYEAYYYQSLSFSRLGETEEAERCLYYISPVSSYYPNREYLLARLAIEKDAPGDAIEHLEKTIDADGRHLNARFQLALLYRENKDAERALEQLAEIERLDPSSRLIVAEKYFLTGDNELREELLRLMGGQSQEALEVGWNYARIGRWKEAAKVLRVVEDASSDPWGTPPVFYYTLAHFLKMLGDLDASDRVLEKAQEVGDNVDRFPFREETELVLQEAIRRNPGDSVARFSLGCLLYHFGRPDEAIGHWQEAVGCSPNDFGSLRALGLAYAEQGYDFEKASEQLEKAILVNPGHVRTFNDLSTIYARAGSFDRQVDLLNRALARSPGDDNLIEGLIEANLIMGKYDQAEELIGSHQFQPRHRTYHLRDKYRFLRYGQGARAYNRGDYQTALEQFRLALKPPVSLGMDDFQFQATPRVSYYIARTLENLGQQEAAREEYQRSLFGLEHLSGDRDSWNSENFHMLLSLTKLDRNEEAQELAGRFEAFANSQLEGRHLHYRSEARYLLGLVKKYRGQYQEARELMSEALKIQPDILGPRYELRGDTLDPISNIQ